jgi:hypothetical protein
MLKAKRGQIMGLSFQMIFSIILIIAFIYVAMIGINAFIDNMKAVKTVNFVVDFRAKLEEAIGAAEFSQPQTYELPSSVTKLCFINGSAFTKPLTAEGGNLSKNPAISSLKPGNYVIFYDPAKQKYLDKPYAMVDCERSCLDISKSSSQNPFCIDVNKGIVKIIITRTIGKPYVVISPLT